MDITPAITEAARALVSYSGPEDEITASRSFLAAIERTSDGFHQAISDCRNAAISVCVSDAAEPRVALLVEPLLGDSDGWEADLTADEAEARGWELIALAHLARKGG